MQCIPAQRDQEFVSGEIAFSGNCESVRLDPLGGVDRVRQTTFEIVLAAGRYEPAYRTGLGRTSNDRARRPGANERPDVIHGLRLRANGQRRFASQEEPGKLAPKSDREERSALVQLRLVDRVVPAVFAGLTRRVGA